MKISRTITHEGKEITLEAELTYEELAQAHEEFVTAFMESKLKEDFGFSNELAKELAKDAYEEYTKGNGLTEYECIEAVVDKYDEENEF